MAKKKIAKKKVRAETAARVAAHRKRNSEKGLKQIDIRLTEQQIRKIDKLAAKISGNRSDALAKMVRAYKD